MRTLYGVRERQRIAEAPVREAVSGSADVFRFPDATAGNREFRVDLSAAAVAAADDGVVAVERNRAVREFQLGVRRREKQDASAHDDFLHVVHGRAVGDRHSKRPPALLDEHGVVSAVEPVLNGDRRAGVHDIDDVRASEKIDRLAELDGTGGSLAADRPSEPRGGPVARLVDGLLGRAAENHVDAVFVEDVAVEHVAARGGGGRRHGSGEVREDEDSVGFRSFRVERGQRVPVFVKPIRRCADIAAARAPPVIARNGAGGERKTRDERGGRNRGQTGKEADTRHCSFVMSHFAVSFFATAGAPFGRNARLQGRV